MICQIRNSAFTRILWGLMGLYLLNISVDTADPNPEHIPENLSFNDQESVVEIVLEQILGYENAIVEYDDHDTEEHNKNNNAKTDLLAQLNNEHKLPNAQLKEMKHRFLDYSVCLANGFKEIDSPPPKV